MYVYIRATGQATPGYDMDEEELRNCSSSPSSGIGSNTSDMNGAPSDRSYEEIVADEVLNSLGCGCFQALAYFLAGISFFAYAFIVMSGAIINLPLTRSLNITGVQYAIYPAMTFLGNGIGSVLFGFLVDAYGRVWPYALFMSVCGLFTLASAFAPYFPLFVALRFFAGVGVGGIQSQVYPMLIEFLPIKHRGQTAVLILLNQAIGSAIAVAIGWALISTYYTNGWRYFVIVSAVPSFLTILYRVLFYFQSPRFLLSKGKVEAMWKVFKNISKINCKYLDTDRDIYVENISNRSEGCWPAIYSTFWKFLDIFKPPLLRNTVCLAIIQPGARLTYISSTIFFPKVLDSLQVNPFLILFVAFLAQVPGYLLMSIISEWPIFGRLNTMRLYMLLAAVFYLLFALIRNIVFSAVLAVFIFFAMNPLLSLVYTYVAETYPTEVRGVASGFFNTVQGLIGITVPFLSGYMADISKEKPWVFPVVWAIVYLILLLVSFILKGETRGRALTDALEENHWK